MIKKEKIMNWNYQTWLFTAYKVEGCDVKVKWSAVSATNEIEAQYKVGKWLSTEPEWKGWKVIKDSIGVDDAKYDTHKTDPQFECGEFFDSIKKSA